MPLGIPGPDSKRSRAICRDQVSAVRAESDCVDSAVQTSKPLDQLAITRAPDLQPAQRVHYHEARQLFVDRARRLSGGTYSRPADEPYIDWKGHTRYRFIPELHS